MRNINVNQAVTNPQPVALPQVLGKGVAQQDTESYKPTGERLSFLLWICRAVVVCFSPQRHEIRNPKEYGIFHKENG